MKAKGLPDITALGLQLINKSLDRWLIHWRVPTVFNNNIKKSPEKYDLDSSFQMLPPLIGPTEPKHKILKKEYNRKHL